MMLLGLALCLTAAPVQDLKWTMESVSMETLVDADSFVQVFQSPVFAKEEFEMRASWAVFWLDRREVGRLTRNQDGGELTPDELRLLDAEETEEPASSNPLPNVFRDLAGTQLAGVGREVYLEGPVEFYHKGERLAVADAIYIDLKDGHGWIANVLAHAKRSIEGRQHDVQVRADWMRHSADGSFRADSATVTSCSFDEPHVRITTGDLRVQPTDPDDLGQWKFRLRQNRLHLFGEIYLPLPPISFNTEGGKPILQTFGLGDSAQLGSFIQASFNQEMGRAGETVNALLKGDPKKYDANYGISASYLGSRGALLDLSAELASKNRYWFKFLVGLAFDSGDDRGLVRVDAEDRSTTRSWIRARGRFYLNESEWFDLRSNHQSDPGVQAEFWESDYLNYELRETYLHWRKGTEQDFVSATVKSRNENFRTDIEEYPEARFYRGLTDLGSLGSVPLIYSANVETGYLRRRDGDPEFEAPFPDGLGDRDVFRFSANPRIEAPVSLGFGGFRAIPYLEGQVAYWDRDVTDSKEVTRGVLRAGLRLATSLWTVTSGGDLFRLAPFVDASTDVAFEESGEVPVRFDTFEDPVDGDALSLGVRGMWDDGGGPSQLDVSLIGEYRGERSGVPVAGWQPVAVFAGLRSELFGVPVGVFHDGRYSVEGGATVYSLTNVGTRLTPDLSLEVSHRRGLAFSGNPPFESILYSGRYRWTPKWEFEARSETSLIDGTRLQHQILIRRYGHDLVFGLEVSDREGLGTSIGISVSPSVIWENEPTRFLSPWE